MKAGLHTLFLLYDMEQIHHHFQFFLSFSPPVKSISQIFAIMKVVHSLLGKFQISSLSMLCVRNSRTFPSAQAKNERCLSYYTEITGLETSGFILGHGEKYALVFHSLCCLSATSVRVSVMQLASLRFIVEDILLSCFLVSGLFLFQLFSVHLILLWLIYVSVFYPCCLNMKTEKSEITGKVGGKVLMMEE